MFGGLSVFQSILIQQAAGGTALLIYLSSLQDCGFGRIQGIGLGRSKMYVLSCFGFKVSGFGASYDT